MLWLKGYDTVDGRCNFGAVFLILNGRQLYIHCSDSEWLKRQTQGSVPVNILVLEMTPTDEFTRARKMYSV